MLLWLPPVGVLVLAYLGSAVLEPAVKAYYGVDIPWWIYPVLGTALVAFISYRGIKVSARLLLITGSIEIAIMVVLAITGLVHPGKGGFSWAPLNPANFSKAPDFFLAIVFAVFTYSGWEFDRTSRRGDQAPPPLHTSCPGWLDPPSHGV